MNAPGKFQPQPFRRQGDFATALYRACVTVGTRSRNRADRWPEDPLVGMILRDIQLPATTTGDAAALVTVMAEFVEALQPMSAAASLFGLATNFSFGRAGELLIPAISDLPMADFIAEGAPMPVVMGLTSGVSMVPYKIGTIVALTSEMMRSGSAEELMEAALIANMGPSLDRLLFSAAAGVPGLRPPGLLNGVATSPPSGATSMSEAMIEDLGTLVEALAPYGGNGQIVFICSPRHFVRLTKTAVSERGYPVFVASNLTGANPPLIAVAAKALAVAIDTPEIETSRQAVMHMDDAPLPIVDDTGVMAAPVRSMWQTDSVGIEFELPVSWALRAPAVSWTTPIW